MITKIILLVVSMMTALCANSYASAIALNNFGTGYYCELWINGEPALVSSDISTNSWSSWPLKEGQNLVKVRIIPTPLKARPRVEVYMQDGEVTERVLTIRNEELTGECVWEKIATIRAKMLARQYNAHVRFDSARAKAIATKICEWYASGDEVRFRQHFDRGLPDSKIFFPKWVTQDKIQRKEIDVRRSNGDEDLYSVEGVQTVMIRRSIEPSGGADLNLVVFKHTKKSVSFMIQCMVFSRDEDDRVWWHIGETSLRVIE